MRKHAPAPVDRSSLQPLADWRCCEMHRRHREGWWRRLEAAERSLCVWALFNAGLSVCVFGIGVAAIARGAPILTISFALALAALVLSAAIVEVAFALIARRASTLPR